LRAFGLFLLALAMAAAPAPVGAQPSEEAVKAAFIPKFARYVQWPAAASPAPRQPFHLCVIGRDPFGPVLDRAAASEQIEGRAVIVRRHASTDGAGDCHLAFVNGPTPNDTARYLLALRGQPVLTITDARAGPQRGIIHFTVAGGRVRFFIDEAAAAERGMSISSRLLALALGVRQRRS
jgi:YfiR/HmsC-like